MPDEGIFHVGARGAGRIPIFLDDDDRHFFLLLLGIAVPKYEWRCYAFCLMSNHYHLIVEARREQLSDGMQLLTAITRRRSTSSTAVGDTSSATASGRAQSRPMHNSSQRSRLSSVTRSGPDSA
jgi:REP element-mobilizing transposase RayT